MSSFQFILQRIPFRSLKWNTPVRYRVGCYARAGDALHGYPGPQTKGAYVMSRKARRRSVAGFTVTGPMRGSVPLVRSCTRSSSPAYEPNSKHCSTSRLTRSWPAEGGRLLVHEAQGPVRGRLRRLTCTKHIARADMLAATIAAGLLEAVGDRNALAAALSRRDLFAGLIVNI